jgi:hypothetical protein
MLRGQFQNRHSVARNEVYCCHCVQTSRTTMNTDSVVRHDLPAHDWLVQIFPTGPNQVKP